MKISVQTSEGEKIVQIVHRKNGTTFIRKAPVHTWVNPPPSLRKTQAILAHAAMSQFGKKGDQGKQVSDAVKEAFEGYARMPKPLNKTELEIAAANPEYMKQVLKIKGEK